MHQFAVSWRMFHFTCPALWHKVESLKLGDFLLQSIEICSILVIKARFLLSNEGHSFYFDHHYSHCISVNVPTVHKRDTKKALKSYCSVVHKKTSRNKTLCQTFVSVMCVSNVSSRPSRSALPSLPLFAALLFW